MPAAQEEILVGALAPVIKAAIANATAPLLARIDDLESRLESLPAPEKGEAGEKGEPGESVDIEQVRAMVREEVKAIPPPKDGKDGQAGKDADEDAIFGRLAARTKDYVDALPKPKDGRDGRDGVGVVDTMQNKAGELIVILSDGASKNAGMVQGRDGKDGAPGQNANVDVIREMISEMTDDKAIDPDAIKALLPSPERGEQGERGAPGESAYMTAVRLGFKGSEKEWVASLKGEPGEPGRDGEKGERGERGEKGLDGAPGEKGERGERGEKGPPGRGIVKGHIAQDGVLKFLYSDNQTEDCGIVIGPEGPPGLDGRDGFGFDDMRLEYDGERTVTFVWEKGDTRREAPVTFPLMIDRGVYEPEKEYVRGDAVTWGGSAWFAQKTTAEKPGNGDGWRLAVKKGRDGKNGKDGDRGPEGKAGRAGRDLTGMTPDGTKY